MARRARLREEAQREGLASTRCSWSTSGIPSHSITFVLDEMLSFRPWLTLPFDDASSRCVTLRRADTPSQVDDPTGRALIFTWTRSRSPRPPPGTRDGSPSSGGLAARGRDGLDCSSIPRSPTARDRVVWERTLIRSSPRPPTRSFAIPLRWRAATAARTANFCGPTTHPALHRLVPGGSASSRRSRLRCNRSLHGFWESGHVAPRCLRRHHVLDPQALGVEPSLRARLPHRRVTVDLRARGYTNDRQRRL